MSLSEISFLADESIHREVIAFLRQRGINATHGHERGLTGSDDISLMRIAHEENLGIITHDSDFGTLAFVKNMPFNFILFLRPGHFDPGFTIGTLKSLIELQLDLSPPTLITATRTDNDISVRIRKMS